MVDQRLLTWLLDSDPSLRWQVQRDLDGEPEGVWAATRARVAVEGFGARLLSHQDEDGRWAGGAYFPADAGPDERMAEAVDLVRDARDADGTWHQQLRHEGRAWFEVDSAPGEPSRWLTLHALRVLAWWDADQHRSG